MRRLQALTWSPEFNVALFTLPLNLAWELWHGALFVRMAMAPHWDAVKTCSSAAAVDSPIEPRFVLRLLQLGLLSELIPTVQLKTEP